MLLGLMMLSRVAALVSGPALRARLSLPRPDLSLLHGGHGSAHEHEHSPFDGLLAAARSPGKALASNSKKVLISLCFLVVPLMVKRRLSRLDGLSFVAIAILLNVFDSAKVALKQQLQRAKAFQESVVKHSFSSFDSRKFFFKNDNAADRVTLLGVWINIVLSVIKFSGGVAFNSAVLVSFPRLILPYPTPFLA